MSKGRIQGWVGYFLLVGIILTGGFGATVANAAVGIVSASPASLNFGSVSIGSTNSKPVTISNSGTVAFVISGISSSNASFIGSGLSLPTYVSPGQSVTLNVVFTPTSIGTQSGSVTVVDNASNGSASIAVSGTGGNGCPCTIWPSTARPSNADSGPDSPVELGVSFRADSSGYITGVRFYKSANNTGTHVGHLWSNRGTLLATATFTGETASGWQRVNFSTPVAITANTVYVASYHSKVGHYSADSNYFANSGVNNSPLHALANGAGGADGPYAYGSTSTFPTSTYYSANYWVDVVFSNAVSLPASVPPAMSAQPTNQTVMAGQSATFSMAATGTAPLGYQWRKGGTAISGATSSSYTTPAETTADDGAQFTVVVSNSAGSVTSSAATLTVNAATVSLNANPTSLSFGSVNIGNNGALNANVTNTGNSNVTISSIAISGAGFNATGMSTGQILTPGQTATLAVTFTPAASGSASGSVSVTSNAANSPAIVSLSGNGVAQSSGGSATPTCGKSGDSSNHVPTDWTTFVPPAKGQSYIDTTFGCSVTRVTDVSSEVWNGSVYLPVAMGYATVSPFNANDSYLMMEDGWNRHFVTDLAGNAVVPIANMPSAVNDGWFLWDATNANVFYYTNSNSLMKGTLSGTSVATTTVHQFSEYAAINFMDETDVSQDGAHVVIIGGDTSGSSPENVFDYNFVTNTKGPVYTTTCTGSVDNSNNGCLHKLIQTPDNNVLIDFTNDGTGTEQGVRLWTGSLLSDALTGLVSLLPIQDTTNHMDTGYDLNGNPVFINVGNSVVLPGMTNPCPSGWGLSIQQVYNPLSAVCLLDNQPSWHVGYRGNAQQPWVGLSFFDGGRAPSPEWFGNDASNYTAPTTSNWQLYEDEIMVVRIDANNNSTYIYRLARAYSRSNVDFYAQPHAAISRDGKYLAFNSNMAFARTGCPANFQTTTGCTDVYVIKVQ